MRAFVPISRPAESLLAESDPEEADRIRSTAREIKDAANWVIRKRRLLDTILALELAMRGAAHQELIAEDSEFQLLKTEIMAMDAEQRRRVPEVDGEEVDPLDESELEAAADELTFLSAMPAFVGSILEILDEQAIASVEQAAFYHLSAHPEHQEAAENWFDADPRHETAFRKFLRANRDYADLLDRFEDMLEAIEEAEELDDAERPGDSH
jgi:hypothetical protein